VLAGDRPSPRAQRLFFPQGEWSVSMVDGPRRRRIPLDPGHRLQLA
jgi:hypothetical protein